MKYHIALAGLMSLHVHVCQTRYCLQKCIYFIIILQ